MTLQDKMAALRALMATAQAERGTSQVEALAQQLSRLHEPPPLPRAVESPDPAQRRLMEALGITFNDGVYRLGPQRFDRLSDAVSSARLQRKK